MSDPYLIAGDVASWIVALLDAAGGTLPLKVLRHAFALVPAPRGATAEEMATAWGRALRGSIARGNLVEHLDGGRDDVSLAATPTVEMVRTLLHRTDQPKRAVRYLDEARRLGLEVVVQRFGEG